MLAYVQNLASCANNDHFPSLLYTVEESQRRSQTCILTCVNPGKNSLSPAFIQRYLLPGLTVLPPIFSMGLHVILDFRLDTAI